MRFSFRLIHEKVHQRAFWVDIKCKLNEYSYKEECMKKSDEKSVIMYVSDEMQMLLNKPDFIELSVCLRLPGGSSADRRPAGPVISGTRATSVIGHEPPGSRRGGGEGEEGRGRIRHSELLVSQDYLLVFELGRLALTTPKLINGKRSRVVFD